MKLKKNPQNNIKMLECSNKRKKKKRIYENVVNFMFSRNEIYVY